MKRILLGMSGGVDSSVAALLLQRSGLEPIGVTFDLWSDSTGEASGADAAKDAKAVCGALGIPHHAVACRDAFRERVIDPFCRAYLSGRTPNPCVICNPRIKFAMLCDLLDRFNASAVATGHYARIEGPDCAGRMRLLKGRAGDKEQSYFLFGMTQQQLAVTEFPLGDLNKQAVRRIAAEADLPVHGRPESQEICFIPDNDYAAFVERSCGGETRPGEIRDTSGRLLGTHKGLHRFTLGQRKGLGVAVGEPRYVVRIEPETATVVIGTREETFSREFLAQEVNWVSVPPPRDPLRTQVRIRYAHPGAAAEMIPEPESDAVRVRFDEPQSAITPGQAAVFYDDDLLLGGGIIAEVAQ